MVSISHFVAAFVLFSILAYFCLGPFRKDAKARGGATARQAGFYLAYGWAIILAMLVAAAGYFFFPSALSEYRLIYWVEFFALSVFGVAWITAGMVIPGLVDKKDALISFSRT